MAKGIEIHMIIEIEDDETIEQLDEALYGMLGQEGFNVVSYGSHYEEET